MSEPYLDGLATQRKHDKAHVQVGLLHIASPCAACGNFYCVDVESGLV